MKRATAAPVGAIRFGHRQSRVHRRVWRSGTAATLLTLALAGSAWAGTIVPNRSVDGVKLGVSEKAVERVLGRPTVSVKCSVFGVCLSPVPGVASLVYGSEPNQTDFLFIKDRLVLIGAFSHSDRTTSGVGPGSSFAVAKKRYRLVFHNLPFGGPPSAYYDGPPPTKTGDLFTLFVIARGRVDWIEVGSWNSSSAYACDFNAC
jgi:hypothetical protein